MDLIDGLRAFIATAQSGSFTGAAGKLGMSNRLASKYVAALETRLGVRLLQRTTRRLGMTPAGETLLARAPALLEELDTLIAEVAEDQRGLSGTIRISAPVTFGEIYVQHMLSRFAAPHPGLVIDLRLDDAHIDLAEGGIDLAFRIGPPGPQAMKQRRLGHTTSVPVAAPGYLARHGTPQRPADLVDHACIADTNRRSPALWAFQGPGGEESVRVRARYLVNSSRAACDLALAGHGIAFLPGFVLGTPLARGTLVPLLPGYKGPEHPISVVYLEGRALPRKLRALIDFAQHDIRTSGLA